MRSIAVDDAAIQLAYAQKVIIVPGYGLAAAQAQHEVAELAAELEEHGIEVSYAIHPVAGRMPGHMNVLLAEANVPYPLLKEMDEINPEFPRTDVALVVGANDVTNPAARRPGTAISGMPILDVDQAKSIIVIKRSMASRLRRHRQRAVREPEDQHVLRRRQEGPDRADRRGQDPGRLIWSLVSGSVRRPPGGRKPNAGVISPGSRRRTPRRRRRRAAPRPCRGRRS